MVASTYVKHLIDPAKVPNGGLCRYVDPETGKTFSHPYFVQVRAWALKHRQVNNLPVPTNWEAWIEDQICQATSGAACVEEGEGAEGSAGPGSVWNMAGRFARSMASWAASGFAMASDEVLAARRLVCEGDGSAEHTKCAQWKPGNGRYGFGRCGACGCAGGLKSAIATETCPKGYWPA